MTGTWIASALLAALCGAIVLPDPVPFKTLDGGLQSGIEKSRTVVVRTADEWKALCGQYAQGRPCPEVDFTHRTVLGVFLGTRPTAGYTVEIVSVERTGDTLVVKYRRGAPGPGDMAAQMMTSPYQLVTIDRLAGPPVVVTWTEVR